MSREVVQLTGNEVAPLTLESEGELRVLDTEENETIGYGESAGVLVENERDLSKNGMLYSERRRKGARLHDATRLRSHWFRFRFLGLYEANRKHKGDSEVAYVNPTRLLPKASAHFSLLDFENPGATPYEDGRAGSYGRLIPEK